MHTTNPEAFAAVLREAADSISKQSTHPGQAIPGVWSLDAANPFDVTIGVIAAAAVARACSTKGYDLDRALSSYLVVSKHISLKPVGAPDKVAIQHLLDAADVVAPEMADA
jgi:hypothetical protein